MEGVVPPVLVVVGAQLITVSSTSKDQQLRVTYRAAEVEQDPVNRHLVTAAGARRRIDDLELFTVYRPEHDTKQRACNNVSAKPSGPTREGPHARAKI
eukprot:1487868-Amphidinium_carterae.2